MKRRGFLKWLGAVAASVALDPLLGDQSVWGTAAPAVKPVVVAETRIPPLALRQAANWKIQGPSYLESGYVYAPYIPKLSIPDILAREVSLDIDRMVLRDLFEKDDGKKYQYPIRRRGLLTRSPLTYTDDV